MYIFPPVITHFMRLVIRQPCHPRPSVLRRRAHHPEDLVQLVVNVPDPRKARVAVEHFYEDAAHAPDVQRGVVVGRPQQDVWWTIPKGYNFVGIGVRRDGFGAGQA